MLAITLARRDFREVDQTIILYTLDQGKLEVVARGVKKIVAKNGPALEPFCVIEVELAAGKEMTYLAKATIVESFTHIREDLNRLYAAAAVLHLVADSTKAGEKDVRVFELLVTVLRLVNTVRTVGSGVYYAFVLKLWSALGFAPVLGECVRCGRVRSAAAACNFAPAEGGIICSTCLKKDQTVKVITLSRAGTNVLEKIVAGTLAEVAALTPDKKTVAQIKRAIRQFVEYHSAKKLPKLEHRFWQ